MRVIPNGPGLILIPTKMIFHLIKMVMAPTLWAPLPAADPVDGDTIGVVPGSFWIASAPLNRGGTIPETIADIILCMQWMIDPDGNPSTNWDVPAICSNSWGFSPYHGIPPCDSLFWAPIDACEAAGIVMLFSVGADQLVVNPASRATDDYRNCSIGAVDANQPGWPIAYFSARGPSYCTPDGSPAIKPEFVAPGVNIRSSVPGGGYAYYSGVSMACPHGAGVVALIKQVNPNLTPDEIKQIIYDTAYDLGPPGEDNSYGWGMVDAYEAVQLAWSQLPPVSIDMIPDNAPIVVQLGHSFTFTGILSNNSDSSQIGDVWIMLDVPEYGVYGPIKRYDNVALASHHTITVPGITQYVPYYAPVGLYNYIAYCGDFPSVVVDSASFEFDAVTPSAGGADEWSLSGWFADDLSNIPSKMALFANHPNPFNATTTISFRLPEKMAATVEIFNLLGEKVIILAEGVLDAGSHNITWDASNYSSGIYLCKFSTPAESKTLRMVLLK